MQFSQKFFPKNIYFPLLFLLLVFYQNSFSAGTAPVVTVTSPASSDSWIKGETHNIVWTCTDDGSVKACTLFYSIDNGTTWSKLKDTASSASIASGSWLWTIPVVSSGLCKVKVVAVDNLGNTGSGESGIFSIIIPSVIITKPNGGEKWPARSTRTITWYSSVGARRTIFFKQGTGGWSKIDSGAGITGTNNWNWSIPDQALAGCYIKVQTYNTTGALLAKDSSDASFEITNTPFFRSPDSVRLATNAYYEYTVDIDGAGSPNSPTLRLLPVPPPWTVFFGGKLIISAPSSPVIDTAQIEMLLDGYRDTLNLRIIVYDPSTPSAPYVTVTSKYFTVEAENGSLTSPMQVVADPNASNGQCISAPAGSGNTIFPKTEASYSFNAPVADTYFVWLRTYVSTIPANNYGTFIGFNSTPVKPGILCKTAGVYEWIRATQSFILSAGINQLILGHGNEQVRIDQIYITNDSLAAAENWIAGTKHNISWTCSDDGSVKSCTLFYRINPASPWTKIADTSSTGNIAGGTYSWTIPNINPSTQCEILVKAVDNAGNVGQGTSGCFSILLAPPGVSITSPIFGDIWNSIETHNITWTCSDDGSVKSCSLFYSVDNGLNWNKLKDTASNGNITSGSWPWVIPLVNSTQAKVRVKVVDNLGNSSFDESGVFTIQIPTLTITKPNGGEKWAARSTQTITWTATSHSTRAIFFRKGTNAWAEVNRRSVSGSGPYGWDWTVPSQIGPGCLIKVEIYNAAGLMLARDSSDQPFEITNTPFFKSPDTLQVPIKAYREYTVEVDPAGSLNSPTLTLLPGAPNWVLFVGGQVRIYAPTTPIVDTVQIEMLLDGFRDTLDLKITIFDPATAISVKSFSKEVRFGLIPQITAGKISFTVGLEKAGKFGIYVYAIDGKKKWAYSGTIKQPCYQNIQWLFPPSNGICFVKLQQEEKQVIQKFTLIR